MSVAFTKYNQFVLDLCSGVHQFQTGTAHVFKLALTNTAPNATTHAVLSDITEITAQNGYSSGGPTGGTVTGSQTTGTFSFSLGTNPVVTATGTVGPFRYCVLYNSSVSSPLKPLIAYFDYTSSITLANTDTFTFTWGSPVFTLA